MRQFANMIKLQGAKLRAARLSIVTCLVLLAATGAASAQTATDTLSILYHLDAGSSYEQGCVAPCLCPISNTGVAGTFVLTPTGFDGLFKKFTVAAINWQVSIGGRDSYVTGSGTYKMGGEVAVQQELSLDLKVGGNPVQHFDSGLVGPTVPVPGIDLTISTNPLSCFHTGFHVIASPAVKSTSTVDIRDYVPAALGSAGYMGFIRVINISSTATPITVAIIDENTGTVGSPKTLTPALPAGAAVTYSATDIERALGGAISAGSRPRIRVGAQVPIQAQSFQTNPGGVTTLNSSALSGTTVDVPSYLPWALRASGFVSYLRVINTGSSATAVKVALIDGDTGMVGTAGTLNSALPPGAAVTYSGQQIEVVLGVTLPASARPRIRVTSTTPVEVQSFQANPGGVVTDNGYFQ